MRRVAIYREAGGLGDVMQCLAVARAYKEAGCHVTFFALNGYADFVQHCPDVDKVISVGNQRRPRDVGLDPARWSYLDIGGPYDEKVDLWCPAFRYEFYDAQETVQRDRMVSFFTQSSEPFKGPGRIRLKKDEKTLVEGILAGLLGWGWEPFVCVAPFTRSPLRDWPRKNWIRVVRDLQSQGHSVLVFCDPSQPRMGFRNAAILGRCPQWALWGVISRAKLFLSGDTGPLHIAGSCGTPALGVFGSTSGELTTSPYPNMGWVQGDACETGPCYYSPRRGRTRSCGRKGCRSLAGVTAGAIWEALRELSARVAPEPDRAFG